MRILSLFAISSALAVTACASGPQEPFAPAGDARIGPEVGRACYTGTRGGGGYVDLGEHDGFVVGDGARSYLLLLSPGCSQLESPFTYPVFQNVGATCLERGELVEVIRDNVGNAGGCRIDRIFEWRGEG
ncbi:MAG: hypothetical protein Tsb0010_17760 [Parvularculaceae bacterium]